VLSASANDLINVENLTIRCNGRGTGIAEVKAAETDELLLKRLKTLNLNSIEEIVIKEALERSSYLQKLAAVKLGISPRALNYKIKEFGITHRSWKKNVGIGSGLSDA
jgi:DNA-binding NtrC family response regulator